MDAVLNLLGKYGLIGPDSNMILLICFILIIALLVISFAKKLIHCIILFSIGVVILGGALFVKTSIIDANGINLEKTRIVSSSGDSMNYADISKVYLRDGNKVVLQDISGDELVLKVDKQYANTIKSVLEGVIENNDIEREKE